MEIYLIRHGQTDWNNLGIVQGRENNMLNKKGISQAEETALKLNHISPTHLISSSLDRARDTIKIISDINDWNLEIYEDDNFIERDFGVLEGGPVEDYKKVDDFSKVQGCETNDQLESRLINGLNNIVSKSGDTDVVVVGCHSHVLKACLCVTKPGEYDYKYSLDNCAILKIDINDNKIIDVQISI